MLLSKTELKRKCKKALGSINSVLAGFTMKMIFPLRNAIETGKLY